MGRIWSRVVLPKHEYEVRADMSNESEKMRMLVKNLVFTPNLSKTAKKLGIPVSTIHDNVKRLDERYRLSVHVMVEEREGRK